MTSRLERFVEKATKDAPAPSVDDGPLELGRREEFARLCVEGRMSQMAAYRQVYNIDPDQPSSMVWRHASRLAAAPMVSRRIRQLKEEAARQTIISAAQLLKDFVDIANADPNELIRMHVDCCRNCHGIDFGYEYSSEMEYAKACDDACRLQLAMPNCGGVAFRPDRDPNPACPCCYGRGVSTPVVGDTRKLSPGARKLYKGIKVTKNGVEVLMHDQHAAREAIGRMLGAFRQDGSGLPPLGEPPEASDADKAKDAADPAGAYMRLVKG